MQKKVKSFDGLDLSYRRRKGKKITLVFIHGVGCNWTYWKKQLNYFERKGFSTLSMDLRGHGLSGVPYIKKQYNLENFSKDLRTILNKEKIKKFVLVGHSFGGAVVMDYCYLNKNFLPKAVVLISTSFDYPFKKNREFNLGRLSSKFLHYIAKKENFKKNYFEFDFSNVFHNSRFHLLKFFIKSYKVTLTCLRNLVPYIEKNKKKLIELFSQFKIPVLVIVGEKDKITPLVYSYKLTHIFPRSEMVVIPGASHLIVQEKSKDINEYISKLLKVQGFK